MAQSDIALKRRIDTLTRKQAYRALIEKGSDISKKYKQTFWRNFIDIRDFPFKMTTSRHQI